MKTGLSNAGGEGEVVGERGRMRRGRQEGGTALTCLEYQSTKKQNLFKRCDHKGLGKFRLSNAPWR